MTNTRDDGQKDAKEAAYDDGYNGRIQKKPESKDYVKEYERGNFVRGKEEHGGYFNYDHEYQGR